MAFISPYSSGTWLRGNLHTHTTNSDGRREPQVVVDDYAKRGYDFLMVSDHDYVTDVDALISHDMTMIYGNEVTAKGPHLLHLNAQSLVAPDPDRQSVLNTISEEEGAMAILAHPNWHRTFDHYTQEELETLQGHIGIEIYNGVIERLAGSPFALDRWDQLLGKGFRVWGFANDDSHAAGDVSLGWNVVQAENRSVASIMNAFATGAFYASTGVFLESISNNASTFSLRANEDVRWRVITDFGKVIHQEIGSFLEWTASDFKGSYVRFSASGSLGSQAWTQPFFHES